MFRGPDGKGITAIVKRHGLMLTKLRCEALPTT
jgi:hypothetical protein